MSAAGCGAAAPLEAIPGLVVPGRGSFAFAGAGGGRRASPRR